MRPQRSSFLTRAGPCALLLLAAACADRTPTEVAPAPALPPATGGLAAVSCKADVRAAMLDCGSGGAMPPGIAAVILGGQGTNVRLASSGTNWDARTEVFSSSVRIENLTAQVLGSVDGRFSPLNGIRVFFASGPVVTQGVGVVSVVNATGEAAFTAAGQKYFEYFGFVAPGDTSAAKVWRFSVPASVTEFEFTVYVYGRVRLEAGWVSLAPAGPSLAMGDTQRITPVVHSVTGQALTGQRVAWASSNPAVATIDSLGLVTAVSAGTALVTATSGGRTGRVNVVVAAAGGEVPPTVVEIETPTSVTANAVDSLTVRVRARAGGAGVRGGKVGLRSVSSYSAVGCMGMTLESGTVNDGMFRCTVVLGNGASAGLWEVEGVTVTGGASRTIDEPTLQAAGVPVLFRVHSANSDYTAPVVTGVSFTPDTVMAGRDSVTVRVTATDAGSGAWQMGVTFGSRLTDETVYCSTLADSVDTGTFVFVCRTPFPPQVQGGTWHVVSLGVQDWTRNRNDMDTTELRAAGFPTELTVLDGYPDLSRPIVTGLTISPDSVTANGVDTVTVRLTVRDGNSGVSYLSVLFTNYTTGQTSRWDYFFQESFIEGSVSMDLYFSAAEAGWWGVDEIRMRDLRGNTAFLTGADLESQGYPTAFLVTPP